jgi:hypothetical protein
MQQLALRLLVQRTEAPASFDTAGLVFAAELALELKRRHPVLAVRTVNKKLHPVQTQYRIPDKTF